MEKFIPGVCPASESEPIETKTHLAEEVTELAEKLFEGLNQFCFYEDDDESEWILFGVGGPA